MARSKYKARSDGRKTTTRTYKHFGLADFSGKKTFYGKTDAEVDKKIAEFETLLKTKKIVQKGTTVKDIAWAWWDKEEKRKSANSKSSYLAKLKEIEKEFGELQIDELTSDAIQDWLEEKAAQGYAQKGINGRKSVLNLVMTYAIGKKLIKENPCNDVQTPKGKPAKKRHPASDEDITKIEEHKTDSLIARMFYFMEYTGCRIGECVVLQEKDIDRKHHKANIYKDIAWEGQEPMVKSSAKTEAGDREIDLYDNVLEILPKYSNAETFIFFPDGLPRKSAFETATKNYRKDSGIEATAHQLRHTYAGIMHSADVSAKDCQMRMGHSSIVITQDIYTEIEKKHNEKIRNKVNRYIMDDRLGAGRIHCKKCGSQYTIADDGHKFKFCPDCGCELSSCQNSCQ